MSCQTGGSTSVRSTLWARTPMPTATHACTFNYSSPLAGCGGGKDHSHGSMNGLDCHELYGFHGSSNEKEKGGGGASSSFSSRCTLLLDDHGRQVARAINSHGLFSC